MSAINSNALSKFVGILEIAPSSNPTSFTRIASVRGLIANIDTAAKQVEVKADDTGTVFKGYTPEARFEGEFLENADRDIIDLLLGGTPSDTAATPVNVTTEVLLDHPTISEWAADEVLWFAYNSGDGSKATSIVIDHAGTPLAEGTDYEVVYDADAGKTGVVRIGTALTLTGDIDADYTYTPNTTESLTIDIDFTEYETFVARITGEDSSGNTRIVRLTEATFEGVYGLSFLDVVENGDITGTSFTIKATQGSQLVYENQII